MKSPSKSLLALLSSMYCHTWAQETTEALIETEGAVAAFSTNGIDGQVKVINGHIIMNLTFEENFDWYKLGGKERCMEGGIYYGIYDSWTYTETNDKMGSDACGVEGTGHRWDPWMACSTLSNNENCDHNENGCVPPGSEKWNADEYEYFCNSWSYQTNPYICEVGDWSGKYGKLVADADDNYRIEQTYSSAFEVDSYDLAGRTMMFRCHDNTRAFCAPFAEYKPNDEELEMYTRPFQETFWAEGETGEDEADNVYSMRAQFGDSGNSYVLLTYYNRYEIVLDSSDIDVPGGCGNEIYYRIFTEWNDAGGDCEAKTSDRFWDPTIVCADNSENGDTNGKGYCEEDYYLCTDRSWRYTCSNYFENYESRLDCAPGDLSAKYGSISIKNNVNFMFEKSGYDPKLPPVAQLVGKSMVLQCSADKAILDCAQFLPYYDDVGLEDENDLNPEEEEEEGSSGKKGEDSTMGVSTTVLIILIVLGGAALVPCIRGIRNRRAGSATGVKDDAYDEKKGKEDSEGRYAGGNIRQQSTSRTATMEGGNGTSTDHYRGRTVPSLQQSIPM